MNTIKESYIFTPFLFSPKYRVWRWLLLAVVGLVITFNMTFIAYQDCSHQLGNRIYLVCISTSLLYGFAMFLNYYYLVPRFLLKDKYLRYLLLLSLMVFLLPVASLFQEYWVRMALELPHRVTSYFNPLILVDNLALCINVMICFLAPPAVMLLQQWTNRKEDISRMEYDNVKTEINKLKGQITPGFLSRTLTNASALAGTDPDKATEMLMQLGQLLRYQLYDCNRERVLLKSEINFLDNFLRVEQMSIEGFEYEISTEGNLNNVFVSPLLFISLIQEIADESRSVRLLFSLQGEILLFRCTTDNIGQLPDEGIAAATRSLQLQYPERYNLRVDKGVIELKINFAGYGKED